MRLLGLALALVVASPSQADDAPLVLDAGVPAPYTGLLLPEAEAVSRTRRLVGCEAEVAVYKAAPTPVPWGLVIGTAVVAVLAGAVGGLVVGLNLKKP